MNSEFHTLSERKRLEETTAKMVKQREQEIERVEQQLSLHLELQMSSLSGGMESAARNVSGSDSFASPESQGSPAQVGKSLLESDCILHFLAEGGGERERKRGGGCIGSGGGRDDGDAMNQRGKNDIERPVKIQDEFF